MRVIWEFPGISGSILVVSIIRTIVFLGLYWGSILGNYHIGIMEKKMEATI